jgi:hypothetical protein
MVKIGHDAENVSITNAILGPRLYLCLLHCACAGVRTKTKLVIRKLLAAPPDWAHSSVGGYCKLN